uniref:Uncharacterized protein n=1 Tax=Lepeophtheirus salmonis TaxID=72036 RepID=A0A0K2V1G3_LEPSM
MNELLISNIRYQLSFDMMDYLYLKRIMMDGRTSIKSDQGRVMISDSYFVMIQDISKEDGCGETNH